MQASIISLTVFILMVIFVIGCAGTEISEPTSTLSPTPSISYTSTPAPEPSVSVTAMPATTPEVTEPSEYPGDTTATPFVVEEANFRLLISDEVNDIEDFEHLYVEITSIGVHKSGESGSWQLLDPEPDPDGDGREGIDLRPLTGKNAIVIWSGNLDPGTYNKVFIYVSNITGILVGGQEVNVKLPSEKLHISKTFTISDSVVNFVYDITVHKAGNSGKYILNPQIAESGADQEFIEIKSDEKAEKQKTKGKPEEGSGSEEGDGEDDVEVIIQGVIESYGNDSVMVEGTLVLIDANTEIEGTLTEGAVVKIEAMKIPEGLLAIEIDIRTDA